MPEFKDHPDDLINLENGENVTKKKTNPGLEVSGGEITASEYNSLEWSTQLKDYSNMRDGDEIIAPTLEALKLPIKQAGYTLEPGDQSDKAREASDYCTWQFENLVGGYSNFEHHALLAMDWGLQLFEPVIARGVKYHNGVSNKTTNIFKRFSPILNETIAEFKYDEEANWVGITHDKRVPEQGDVRVNVDAKELLRFTWQEEYNDIRGRSILRTIREVWKLKKQTMRATARGAVNGAGLPIAETNGKLSTSDLNNLKKALRTVGNVENAYLLGDVNKVKFRLESLSNQENNNAFIEILNRGIFFNSLTQFMTSGIGQNGSRAATSEHKTTFELATVAIQRWLEERMQLITDMMIDMSYLANMDREARPKFTYNNISETNLTDAANQIKTMYESNAIVKQAEDEDHFRKIFGYPEIVKQEQQVAIEESQEESVTEIQEQDTEFEQPQQGLYGLENNSKQANLERAKSIFEFDSANEHFITTQEKVTKVTDDMMNKIFSDIERQLKGNHKKDIDVRFQREFVQRLTNIYEEGKGRGVNDMNKEILKVDQNGVELAIEPKTTDLARKPKTVIRGINRAVSDLLSRVKNGVEGVMERLNNVALGKAGGVDGVLLKLQTDAFKKPRRQVITETERGYNDGRADVMRLNNDVIESWIYSAMLDENLCEVCGPLDGETFTRDEIATSGLNRSQPVNPGCLGNLSGEPRCRCQWVPNTNDPDKAEQLLKIAEKEGITVQTAKRRLLKTREELLKGDR